MEIPDGDCDHVFGRCVWGSDCSLQGLSVSEQLSAHPEIADYLAIVSNVVQRDDAGGKQGQVLCPTPVSQCRIAIKLRLERYDIGDSAGLDRLADGGEDAAVKGVGEMLWLHDLGGLVPKFIASQQCRQQCLLGIEIEQCVVLVPLLPAG